MPSWAGIGSVTICMLTFVSRSANGLISCSPGPRGSPCSRPKRSTIPRSNWVTTRTLAAARTPATSSTTTTIARTAYISPSATRAGGGRAGRARAAAPLPMASLMLGRCRISAWSVPRRAQGRPGRVGDGCGVGPSNRAGWGPATGDVTHRKRADWIMASMDRQQEFVLRTLEERDIRFVRLWFTDVSGYLKAVAVAPAEIEAAFAEGIGFDGSAIEGFARIYESDMLAKP